MNNNYFYAYYLYLNPYALDKYCQFLSDSKDKIRKLEIYFGLKIHLFYTGSQFSSYIGMLVFESIRALPKSTITELFEYLSKLDKHNLIYKFRKIEDYKYNPQSHILKDNLMFSEEDSNFCFLGGYYELDKPLNIEVYLYMMLLEQLFFKDCGMFQEIRDNGISYLTVSQFERKSGRYLFGPIFESYPGKEIEGKVLDILIKYVHQLTVPDCLKAKQRLIDTIYLQDCLHSSVRIMPFFWHLDCNLKSIDSIIKKIELMDILPLQSIISKIKYGKLYLS